MHSTPFPVECDQTKQEMLRKDFERKLPKVMTKDLLKKIKRSPVKKQ